MINRLFEDIHTYLLKYAKATYSCLQNAEDVTQEVILDLLHDEKFDITKDIDAIKAFARNKMAWYMQDNYKQAKSTGVNFMYEVPAENEFLNYAEGDEDGLPDNEKKKRIFDKKREGFFKIRKRLKINPDVRATKENFIQLEFDMLKASFQEVFTGREREIFNILTSGIDITRQELADKFGITRQRVIQIIQEKIHPKIKEKLMLAN
jgi:RNA polymerase sigma factor (sigma-70 family)